MQDAVRDQVESLVPCSDVELGTKPGARRGSSSLAAEGPPSSSALTNSCTAVEDKIGRPAFLPCAQASPPDIWPLAVATSLGILSSGSALPRCAVLAAPRAPAWLSSTSAFREIVLLAQPWLYSPPFGTSSSTSSSPGHSWPSRCSTCRGPSGPSWPRVSSRRSSRSRPSPTPSLASSGPPSGRKSRSRARSTSCPSSRAASPTAACTRTLSASPSTASWWRSAPAAACGPTSLPGSALRLRRRVPATATMPALGSARSEPPPPPPSPRSTASSPTRSLPQPWAVASTTSASATSTRSSRSA